MSPGTKANYWHSMLGQSILVTIKRADRRGYYWVELPTGEVRRVKAMYLT